MLRQAREILTKAGWVMIGHYSGEYWTNGERRVCLSQDEVRVFSTTPCIMSLDSFVETKGKGVVV